MNRWVQLAAMGAAVSIFWVPGGRGIGQAPQSKTMLIEPPTPLLPGTLDKLTRVAQGDVGDGLDAVDAVDKRVLQEDGLRRFARSDYAASQNGPSRGSLTVYQFGDVSGAISAYDYLQKPGMRPEKLGDSSLSNNDELLMRSGTNVVVSHLKLSRDELGATIKDLIDHLPKPHGPAALSPLLPTLLPQKGLDADSEKYALGPAGYQSMNGSLPAQSVGFQKSAETITAKYKGGGTLTLVLYPTPQIAGDYGRQIETAMKQETAAPKFSMHRDGTLLAVATGAWPGTEAQNIVDSVHMRTEVSFDKPLPLDFQTEVRKTYTLLQSIAIFCGLGALAAIVLGLFFGGGRALIRVMQGKPAATEPEFLHIDLRGVRVRNLKSSGE